MPEPQRDVAPLPLGVMAGPFRITGIYETRPNSYLYAASGPEGLAVLEEFVPPGAVREYDGTLKPRDERAAPLYTAKLNRFKTSSKTMGTVVHPNVVKIAGAFRHGQTSFRVFPWIPRRTLSMYLQALPEHALRPELAPGLLGPLLAALEAGHALNLVHHALNPYTVWMSGTGELLLSSFGDAYLEIREGYSAPELYTPVRGAIGPRTDMYSLAATAVRALTAAHPPSAARRRELADAGGQDPMDLPLGQLRAVLDRGIHEALWRSLRLDWEERPQSVQEFRKIMNPHVMASVPGPAPRQAPPPLPAAYPEPAPPPAPYRDAAAPPQPAACPEPVPSPAPYRDAAAPPSPAACPVPVPPPAPYPDETAPPPPEANRDPVSAAQYPYPPAAGPFTDPPFSPEAGSELYPSAAGPFTDPAASPAAGPVQVLPEAGEYPYSPPAGPFTDPPAPPEAESDLFPPAAGPFTDPAASPATGPVQVRPEAGEYPYFPAAGPFTDPAASTAAGPVQDRQEAGESPYFPAAGPFTDPPVPPEDESNLYPPAAGPFTDPAASTAAGPVQDRPEAGEYLYPPPAGRYPDPDARSEADLFAVPAAPSSSGPYQYPPAEVPSADEAATPASGQETDPVQLRQSPPAAVFQDSASAPEPPAYSAAPDSEEPEVLQIPIDQILIPPLTDEEPSLQFRTESADEALPEGSGDLPPGLPAADAPSAAAPAAPDYGDLPPGFGLPEPSVPAGPP
ncbi:MAG: hypothetical protein LBQ79_07505, partial [Deltaproteobacteria bacterium]|nr:hypothetical protein [Deltaproteobacteria bacterium]